eukprot:PhM_4_TR7722/c0_g1_i1/m.38091/K13111/SMU1; WD40 repeat-containing protein SMU1
MSTGSLIELDSRDIVRLMMQFCAENGLVRSLEALHNDTGVPLNAVPSIEDLHRGILAGQWASVLMQLNYVAIPSAKLFDLYEHILMELVAVPDVEAAKRMLYDTDVFTAMKGADYVRYTRNEQKVLTASSMTPEKPSEKARADIAATLCQELSVVPTGRLVSLLSDAVRWQQSQGLIRSHVSRYDLFTGRGASTTTFVEKPTTHERHVSKMASQSSAECLAVSRDGRYVVTGSVDGFVEVWDPSSGELRMDLPYQASDHFMRHDAAVLCIAIHSDSDVVASGAHDGVIKTWRLATGQCTRHMAAAHAQGVTCIRISKDGATVLSGAYDGGVRVHSLLHNHVLQDMRQHTAYVNDVLFSDDEKRVFSASGDGTVRAWDVATGSCLSALHVPNSAGTIHPACAALGLVPCPWDVSRVIVACRSSAVHVLNTRTGELEGGARRLPPKAAAANARVVAVSPRGSFVYVGTDRASVHVFAGGLSSSEQGGYVGEVVFSDVPDDGTVEIVSIAHSKRENLVVVALSDGSVRWLCDP